MLGGQREEVRETPWRGWHFGIDGHIAALSTANQSARLSRMHAKKAVGDDGRRCFRWQWSVLSQ